VFRFVIFFKWIENWLFTMIFSWISTFFVLDLIVCCYGGGKKNPKIPASKPVIHVSGQSPIDIVTKNVKHEIVHPFKFTEAPLKKVKITKKEHGFYVSGGGIPANRLSGGGLSGKYRLAQFHFHWGVASNADGIRRGSEHTVDGRQSPAEVHFVHFKTKFASLTEAVQSGERDALSVIGILIETDQSIKELTGGNRRNDISRMNYADESTAANQNRRVAFMNLLTDALVDIQTNGVKSVEISTKDFVISDLHPDNMDQFWSYFGSLTTPEYPEVIAWRVITKRVVMPHEIIERLSSTLKNSAENVILSNWRPVQPKEGTVWINTAKNSGGHGFQEHDGCSASKHWKNKYWCGEDARYYGCIESGLQKRRCWKQCSYGDSTWCYIGRALPLKFSYCRKNRKNNMDAGKYCHDKGGSMRKCVGVCHAR